MADTGFPPNARFEYPAPNIHPNVDFSVFDFCYS